MNLSGIWECDDGATYYVRQIGDRVFWFGENQPEQPVFSNVAVGIISHYEVILQWSDVPKGMNLLFGAIVLQLSPDGNQMEAIHKNGAFIGSIWKRIASK